MNCLFISFAHFSAAFLPFSFLICSKFLAFCPSPNRCSLMLPMLLWLNRNLSFWCGCTYSFPPHWTVFWVTYLRRLFLGFAGLFHSTVPCCLSGFDTRVSSLSPWAGLVHWALQLFPVPTRGNALTLSQYFLKSTKAWPCSCYWRGKGEMRGMCLVQTPPVPQACGGGGGGLHSH